MVPQNTFIVASRLLFSRQDISEGFYTHLYVQLQFMVSYFEYQHF